MGYLPIRSCSGNQYIILAHNFNSNTILVKPFKSKKDLHRITSYRSIMIRLHQRGHKVDLQVINNRPANFTAM